MKLLRYLGRPIVAVARDTGGMALLFIFALRALWPPQIERDETLRVMCKFGYMSLPIVAATSVFVGGIMVLQAATYVTEFGAQSLVGWATGWATLREVGPVLIGLMFSGRVGANNTAELATMNITEQLDALRVLAIDPLIYLFVPRLIAMIAMLVCLTAIGDIIALGGGAVVAKLILDLDVRLFFKSLFELIHLQDLWLSLAKAFLFGATIATVSSYFGMRATGGTRGVGRAVNASVVANAVVLFVADYFMTALGVHV